ncbi:MAG: LLM class F420-dependent oxidoreductase [Candidatus Binatia bacterium]|nr:MAG: LLM class F420-dependent oxidoreductase [Candidatus Binatia bacterium]
MSRTSGTILFLAFLLAFDANPVAGVEFGVQLAPEKLDYDSLRRAFQLVERLGYESVWLNDHFLPLQGDEDDPHFETWTLLPALGKATQKIRVGVLVSGNTYRHPAVLAKMAATVDHILGGRLEFGIGAGWAEREHRAYGIPFYTARERAERLGEALETILRLWTRDRADFRGRYYRLEDAPFAPKPLQRPHPPIVVGGQGRKWILPLVARYADEWNVPVGIDPEGIRARKEILHAECQRVGRTPCVERISVMLPLVHMSGLPLAEPLTRLYARTFYSEGVARSLLAGSPESIRERIRAYVDAGVTRIVVTTRPRFAPELLERFAREVVPAFR